MCLLNATSLQHTPYSNTLMSMIHLCLYLSQFVIIFSRFLGAVLTLFPSVFCLCEQQAQAPFFFGTVTFCLTVVL